MIYHDKGTVCGANKISIFRLSEVKKKINFLVKDFPVIYQISVPLWPPYPRDLAGWETVPNELKPSVHRMADGLACRVDRIRACGNGVVPLAAAYAWRTLRACFDQD